MPSDWCQENGRGSRYEQVVGIVGIIQDWRGFRWWTARSGCLDQLTRVGFGRPVILQMWSMRAWRVWFRQSCKVGTVQGATFIDSQGICRRFRRGFGCPTQQDGGGGQGLDS